MSKEERRTPKLRFKGYTANWEQRKLGKSFKVTMGQSPASKYYSENEAEYILIQGNADLEKGEIIPRIYTSQANRFSQKEDIIFTVRAPVGETALNNQYAAIGRGVAAIDGNLWLYYFLKHLQGNNYWRRFSTGSTFDSVNSKDLKRTKIYIPSESEQKSVGSLLNNLEKIITKNHQLVKLKKDYRKVLLNHFFRDTSLGNSYKRLGELIIRKSEKNTDEKIERIESVSNTKGLILQSTYFDDYRVASQNTSNYTILKQNYFVYNPSRINVGSIALKRDSKLSIVSPLYISFIVNDDNLLDEYLFYWFKTAEFDRQRLKYSEGSVRDTLGFKELSEMIINLPSTSRQRDIVKILNSLDKLIVIKQKKLDDIKKIKNYFR